MWGFSYFNYCLLPQTGMQLRLFALQKWWITKHFKSITSCYELSGVSLSYKLVNMLSVCVCLDVNEGGTNYNRCTQRLVILHAQTYKWTWSPSCWQPETRLVWPTLPVISPATKWVWIGIFKPAENHRPWDACIFRDTTNVYLMCKQCDVHVLLRLMFATIMVK